MQARRTVAWAVAENVSDPLLLRWRKLDNQPWVNHSVHVPPGTDTYCDPLTWRSEGLTGQQMVGAIVRSGPSAQITGWEVNSTASRSLHPAGTPPLRPDIPPIHRTKFCEYSST